MLTRKRLGYGPGSRDADFLAQDISALDADLDSAGATHLDLMAQSAEMEDEARRLRRRDLIVTVIIQRSDILMAARRYPEALTALAEADRALGDLPFLYLKVGIFTRTAEATAHLRNWKAVSDACERGIALVEAQRDRVSGPYLQGGYLRSCIGLYTRGVQAAYEQGDYPLMLRRAELSKCRSMLRTLGRSPAPGAEEEQAEREFLQVCRQVDDARAAGDDSLLLELLTKRGALWEVLCIHRARARDGNAAPEFDLEAVRATLDADEAILYYYWIDPHALLIVEIDRDGLVAEVRPISTEDRSALERFSRGVLESLNPQMPGFLKYVDRMREFSASLMPREIARRLEARRRLLISPHRLLHALPFHVLPWDDKHSHLIRRFAVAYIPNLSCLLARYPAPGRQRLLGVGVGDYRVPGYRLDPLVDAEAQVDELEHLYARLGLEARILRTAEASGDRLRSLIVSGAPADAFTTLHIATHGENVNSDTPMESHIFLHDSLLEGLEIAHWRLDADLVVLSACSSGQRPIGGRGMLELPGDDLFGLQAAFFAAGVRQILGTLWPVHSDVARVIMMAFHGGLLAGQSPELALQAAVVGFINGAGPKFRSSFYWAAFFLSTVGRPRRRGEVAATNTGPHTVPRERG
jgi:hypothetical protein